MPGDRGRASDEPFILPTPTEPGGVPGSLSLGDSGF